MSDLVRNLDAERALLCAIMLDPRHYPKLRPRIVPGLFSGDLHAELAAVFDRVHRAGQDITMLSVLHEIDRDDDQARRFRDTKPGMELIVELTAAKVPSSAAETYLAIVEEASHKRGILAATEELQTPKLAGKLDYSKLTLDALGKWMDNGAKRPKRDYKRKWTVKKANETKTARSHE